MSQVSTRQPTGQIGLATCFRKGNLLGHIHAHRLHFTYGCFRTTRSDRNSGDRDSRSQSPKYLPSGPLQKKIADRCFIDMYYYNNENCSRDHLERGIML